MYSSIVEAIGKGASAEPDMGAASNRLVVLDDVSTLEWIGYSPIDIIRFVRAVRSLCLKVSSFPPGLDVHTPIN